MQNRYRKCVLLVLVLVCVLLLWGCQGRTDAEKESYTVTYYAAGKVLKTQSVVSGSNPAPVSPDFVGAQFAGWQDADGKPADPEKTAITGDTAFYALVYPDLTAHKPFLFAEGGFLQPDSPLTEKALAQGLQALAVSGAQGYLPVLPESETAVTKQAFLQLLSQLFPTESVQTATELLQEDTVTRADFARVMVALTRQDAEEKVIPAGEVFVPLDVSANHPGLSALLEASVSHAHDVAGVPWEEFTAPRQSGFFNVDGWLYYIDENGVLARNTTVGTLTFGADGRYTCGDAELDATVAGILKEILQKHPDAERIDLLRRAFEYTRDSFTYRRRYDPYAMGETGWEITEAKAMFADTKGNCYSFASAFWALARGLGYDAVAISGTMLKDHQPHGWVEIVMEDGEPYIFDPEMEYVYVHERDDHSHDMFMVTYTAGQWWNYRRA